MAKPPPPTSTSTSDPALPTTTTTSSAPKASSRPSPAGLLAPLAASARSLLTSARRSPVTTLAAAFFLLALVMYGEDARTIAELSIDDYLYPDADLYNVSGLPPLTLPPPTCDLSRGRWVFDNVSVPAYREKDCTFLTKQVSCLANGRPDDMWQYWRWQPNDCSLPTFDARRFMEAMRGKRLMFVGDSLNRNQWESLVCLVQPILSKGRKKIVKRGSFNTFYAKEYRATLEFYWAPFLVESNSDNPNFHSIKERIISPERIQSHARNWKDVDYLIFNTYIWWMNNADIKVRRPNSKSWSENDEVPRIEAYGQVFKTWSDWLNDNIDPARTSVFFMTISSPHLRPPNKEMNAWGGRGERGEAHREEKLDGDCSGTVAHAHQITENRGLSTLKDPRPLPYKQEVANYVKNRRSSLSLENRTMMKQSFINLTVPAVYSGVLWLVSAGADIVKDTLLNRGTLDDPSTTQLPAEVEALKEDLDDKLLHLFKAFEDSVKGQSDIDKLKEIIVSLKDEKETKESQIIMLREMLLEKDVEIEMFKDLLAGRMRQFGVVWFKYFAKNLNNSSLLSYYDAPEHTGLIYWHPN